MSTKAKKTKSPPDPATLTYEAAAEELEALIERIDEGEIALEEAMELHRRGQALVQRCRALLDAADEELKQLSLDDPALAGDGGNGAD